MALPARCDALERRVLMTAVTSFTLINADTDQPMAGYAALKDGATLDLSALPTRRMNVRADVDATTRSVRFGYEANANYRVESGAPFALASDSGGNYVAWTPTVGTHTVRATPYAQTGATGTVGAALSVTFQVVSGPTSPPPASPPPAPPTTGGGLVADLMNSVTDTKIATMSDGYVIDMNEVGTRLNIRATPSGAAGSIVFRLDGAVVRTETYAPYGIGGDAGGNDFLDWTPPAGQHTLEILQYTEPRGAGTVVASTAFGFTAIPPGSPPTSPPPPPPPATAGPATDLMNSATDTKIATLTDGYVIDQNQVGSRVTIRALPAGTAGSIVFELDGEVVQTETYAPYSIGGDVGGDLQDWAAPTGQHMLRVIQYAGPTGTGEVQGTTTLSLTVTNPVPPPPPTGGPGAPSGLTATAATATTLDLSWTAPTDAAGEVTAYRISYAPGEYAAGAAGQWQTVEVPGTATSVQLSGLLSFALYSIDVAAVTADGAAGAAHVNAWTAKPAGMNRYLYLFNAPKNVQGFETLKRQIEVFDIANGHRWVKNIPIPGNIYNIRGVAASEATGKLYISYFLTAVNGYQPGGLMCLDINTNQLIWRRDYPATEVPSPDRFDVTPDGKTIYLPVGEHGPDRFWAVVDAANGNVTGRIYHTTAPHNTIVSLDGKYAFLEGQEKGTQPADVRYTIGVVDTATHRVVGKVGPFFEVIRPFTINGSTTLAFATMNDFIGFQIGDIRTGKVLFTSPVPGATQPAPDFNRVVCHGIALTPDEKEIWLVDTIRVGIHVFDVSGVKAGRAPTYVKFVQTRRPGRALNGTYDPIASRDSSGVPAWVNRSHDGKYMYGELGEVIDVATKTVVGQLRGKELNSSGQLVDAPYSHSRFMLEVDVVGGRVVKASNQFGVGLVR